jgi:hypothetical protein
MYCVIIIIAVIVVIISARQAKLVLQDAFQLLMFVGTLTYLEPEPFLCILLYNNTFLIINGTTSPTAAVARSV